MNFIQSINGSPNGMFGRSLAINKYQNVLAVGEPGYNSNIGAVKLYSWNGTTWNIMGNTIVGNLTGDSTGYSVALNDSGTIVAFGEIGYDPPSYSNNGRIRVFYWNSSINDWFQYGNDLLGILGMNNNFGSSVSISNDGNTIACGAPNYNSNSGYVYIYNYNNGNWNSIGNMAGIDANALTGSSVKLSNNGNIIAISSPQYNNGYYYNLGYTQIYTYNGGSTWNQIGTNFANAYSFFIKTPGPYCKISSTTVYGFPQGTIECWVKIDPFASKTGSRYEGCLMGRQGEDRTIWCSDGGHLISQDGYLLLFNNSTPNTLFATKFKIKDGVWHHVALTYTSDVSNNAFLYVDGILTQGTITTTVPLDITNVNNVFTNSFTITRSPNYGLCIGGTDSFNTVCAIPYKIFNARIWNVTQTQANIALYMNQIITSAPGLKGVYHINQNTGTTVNNQANISDANTRATITGADYQFVYDNPTGIIGINGNNTYSGSSISLANNGNTIAIGEPGPINGRLGNVRVFNRNYSNWVLVGNTINTTTGNNFGSSVSLTEDGTYLSVGAYSSNIAGNSGYVRLYNYSNNNWNQVGSTINGSANQTMGYSTALSNNLLAVGAPSINTNGNGSVTIYKIITNATITVNSSYSQTIGNNSIFNLNATSTNNETPIQYTSINPLIANVDSYGNITIYSAGNTRIQLYQPNTTNYYAVTANTIVYVNKNLSTLSIQNFNVAYLTPSFSILPNIITNNSEGPTYTYNSTYPNVANIVADILTIGNAGTANISITQSETANYLSVTANTTVTVSPLQSTLNYTIPSNIKYKDLSFNLLANSNNQSATILYSALNPLIANVTSTGNVIVGNAGTANINLTIVGTNNYVGISSNILITVNKLDANLGYPFPSYTKKYKDASFNLNANTTNTDSSQILYSTNNASVAIVDINGNVIIGNAGIANITLTGNASTNYNSVSANILITVNKIDANLGYSYSSYTKNYKDLSFNLNANTSNPESSQIVYSTDNPIVANVNTVGNVTVGNTGIANITLTGSATTNYNSVTANILITVNPIQANLGYPYASYTKNYLDASFQLNANTTNTDSSQILYSTDNPSVAVADINGNVTLGNVGIANIILTGSATTNYNSTTANILVTVNKILANITVNPNFTTYYGINTSFPLNASTTNTDSSIIDYTTDNPTVATVNINGNVILGNVGVANILLSQNTQNYTTISANTTITVLPSYYTIDWNYQTALSPFINSYNINCATYGNGIYVINHFSGSTTRLFTSSNLTTWTTNSISTFNSIKCITYGNNLFVALRNSALPSGNTQIYYSNSQGIFTSANYNSIPNIIDVESIVYGNNLFVAVASTVQATQVITSTDGKIWNKYTAPASNWNGIAYGNGAYVAVAPGNVMTSQNGISWTLQTNIPYSAWDGIAYGNVNQSGLFVAIAPGNVMTSQNGISWTLQANIPNNNWTSITYGGNTFVAVATSATSTNNQTMTSNDGITWNIGGLYPGRSWNTVIYGNNEFVTFGSGNTMMVGTPKYKIISNTTINPEFNKNYKDASFNIISNITTNNTESPIIQYVTGNAIVANVVGDMLIIGNAGNTNISINQYETSNYGAVTVTTRIVVNKLQPILNYESSSYEKKYKDLSFNLKANTTNTDSNRIQYSTDNPLVAVVSSTGNVTIGNAGTANITLTGNASNNYNVVTANILITVNKIQANLGYPNSSYIKNYLDASFNLRANTTNTDSTQILYSTDNPLVAIVNTTGNVTIGNVGTANILLTGNATTNYNSVTANILITVNKTNANLNYPYSSYTKKYLDASFNLNANTTNTDSTQILYSTDNTSVAIVDINGNVTIGNVGTANILLTGNATTNYNSVTANILIAVNKTNANLNYPNSSYTKNYLDASFNLNANTTNTDSTQILYSTDNTEVAIVDVNGNVIIGNTGTANISLTSNATTNYNSVSANILVTVNKLQANLTYPYSSYTKKYLDTSFNLNVNTTNTDNSEIYYSSDNLNVASVDAYGTVTVGNSGTANITMIGNASINYYAVSANTIIYVEKLQSVINVSSSISQVYGTVDIFNIGATTNNIEANITYNSLNPSVVTVDTFGNVTIVNTGNTILQTYQPETTNFLSTTANTIVNITTVPGNWSITYVNHLFVAINSSSNLMMISSDGIHWIMQTTPANNYWQDITFGNGQFVSISNYGDNRILTANVPKLQAIINVNQSTFNATYNDSPFQIIANTTNTDSTVIQYSSGNTNIATVDQTGKVTIVNAGNTNVTLYQPETIYYLSATASVAININKFQPYLVIANSFNNIYQDASFNWLSYISTDNTDSTRIIQYSSTDPIVANVVGDIVTIGNVGNTTITLTQLESTNFLSVTANTVIYVNKKQAVLNYTSSYQKTYRDASFLLNANTTNTDSSQILYSTDNSTVAIVNSIGNVTIGNVGTANIRLTGNETANYLPISANITVDVQKLQATLQYPFSSYTKNYLDASFTLNANTTNTDSTQILYTTDNASVASVNASGNVIIGNAGTASITLTGNETANYLPIYANILVTILKLYPNLNVNSTFNKIYKDATFNLNANTSNTDNISIEYRSDNINVAVVSASGNVTIGNTGTANILLTRAETTNYFAVFANTIVNVTNKLSNLYVSPSFTTVYGNTGFMLDVITENTETEVQYSSDSPNVANVVAGNVTVLGAGNANITVSQPATTNYDSASINTIIRVLRNSANITVDSSFNKTYNDAPFNLNASTTNTDTSVIEYQSSNPTVANVVDGLLIVGNAGSAVITLSQPETANFLQVSANTVITVNPYPATLTFPTDFTQTYLDASFSILPDIITNNQDPYETRIVTYISDNPIVANIVAGNLIIGNAGTANITLTQPATLNYTTVSANTTITVNPYTPTVSIPNFTKTYLDASFSILPNISTNNQDPYNTRIVTYSSDNTVVANIIAGVLIIGNAGTASITLTQPATLNYTSVSATTVITVNKYSPNLTVPNFTKTYLDSSFSILPNISTNNQDPYNTRIVTYRSDNTRVAYVVATGNLVIGNVGYANITLTQPETLNYTSVIANSIVQVTPFQPILSVPNYTQTYLDQPFSILPDITTNNKDPYNTRILTYNSNNEVVANIVDGTLTIGNAGTANIQITQSATLNYKSVSANTTVTVNPYPSELTIPNYTQTYLDASFSILQDIVTNNQDPYETRIMTYSSDNLEVANIVDGNLIIGNAGTANITLTQSATLNYTSVSANTTITVNQATPTLSIPNFTQTYLDASFSILPNISTDNQDPYNTRIVTYSSNNPVVANIIAGVLIIGNAGTARITLTQPATLNYTSVSVNTNITVNRYSPNLTVSNFTQTHLDASFSILPNISTNNQDPYNTRIVTYQSDNTRVAYVVSTGNLVIGNVGNANITLTQPATLNYTSVTAKSTVQVTPFQPNLSIPNFTQTYLDQPFSILPNITTNNKDPYNTRILTYSSDNIVVANIVEGSLTIGNAGTANIRVTQSATLNYKSVSANTVVTVNPYLAELTIPNYTQYYLDASFSILPDIITNNQDPYETRIMTYQSDNSGVAYIVDGNLIIGNVGTANISFTQSATLNYTSVTANSVITVNPTAPTLSIPNFTQTYLDASFSILPNISTNNRDPYETRIITYSSNNPIVANIVEGILIIGNAGTAKITLTQPATLNYAAISANTIITVNKYSPNLTVPNFTQTYLDSSFSILPNISTNNQDPYETRIITYTSDNTRVAYVVAGNLVIGNVGNANITLTQPTTLNYTSVTAKTLVRVTPFQPNLSIPNFTQTYLDQPFSILPNITTNNKDPYNTRILTYNSDNIVVASIDAGILTVGNAGTANIRVTQSATLNYKSVSANTVVTVNPYPATLTIPNYTKTYSDASFSILPDIITNNQDPYETRIVTYSSDNSGVAYITDGNLIIGNVGTANVQLTQPATLNYTSVTANTIIQVNRAIPTLSIPPFYKTYLDASFSILPNISTNNKDIPGPTYTYQNYNSVVANIVAGNLIVGNAGNANITITQSSTLNYTSVSANIFVNVSKFRPNLVFPSSFTQTYNDDSFSILPNISTNNQDPYNTRIVTYLSDKSSVAFIFGGSLYIRNAGTANITLTQPSTLNYTSVTTKTIIYVNKFQPNLTIPDFTQTYLDNSFSITPYITTTNNGDVPGPKYTYQSYNPVVANIVSSNLFIGNAGTANISITLSSTANYKSVTANIVVTVNPFQPNLTVPNFTKTYLDPSVSILSQIVTNNKDPYNTRIVTYSSDNSIVANIVAGILTVGNAGTANVQLTQPATLNYKSVSANTIVTVNKYSPSLTVPNFTQTYLDLSFSILPNITTDNQDPYNTRVVSYSSDNSIVANIIEGNLIIGNAGTANVMLTQPETLNYTSVSANTVITVNKYSANLTVPSSFTQTYLDASFSILPNIRTNNQDPYSTRIVTYSSDNSAVANIITGNLIIGNAGTANIRFTQPATLNYTSASANTVVNVNLFKPSLTIPNFTKTYLDQSVSILPNIVTNNLDVPGPSYTYQTYNSVVADIVDGNLIIGNAGNTTITITQSSTLNYTSVSANIIVTVIPLQPNLTIPYFTQTYLDASFSIIPNISTNNQDPYETRIVTYSSDNLIVANILDGNLIIGNVGTANITLTQPATLNYTSVTANTVITVNPAIPTLSIPNFTKTYLDASYSILPDITTSNQDPYDTRIITYTSNNPVVADIVAGILIIGNAGTANITLTQPATLNYTSVIANTIVTVNKLQAQLNYTPSYNKTYKDVAFPLNANTTNTDNTQIDYYSNNRVVANVNNSGIVTIGNAGTANISLSGIETPNYLPVFANVVISVEKLSPNITVDSSFTRIYQDTPFNINASTTNSETNISYTSLNTDVATIDQFGILAIGNVGNAIIQLRQAETLNYSAVIANTIIYVTQKLPIISVDSSFTRIYQDASFNINASTTNSETDISYISLNKDVATVNRFGIITIGNVGNAIIQLYQPDTLNYSTITANTIIYVTQKQSSISVNTSFNRTYKDISFNLGASSINPEIDIQYSSSNPIVANVVAGIATIGNAGTATITLYQPDTYNYLSTTKTTTINVFRKQPAITVVSTFNKIYQDDPFLLNSITTNPETPIEYSSSNPIVANAISDLVTVGNVGNSTITLYQPTTTNYLSITATTSINVGKSQPYITVSSYFNGVYQDPPFLLNSISTNLETPIQYSSSNPNVATVVNDTATIGNVGSTAITLYQPSTLNYNSVSIDTYINVFPKISSISVDTSFNVIYGSNSFYLNATTNNTESAIQYNSSNPGVARVIDGGQIIVGNVGNATISLFQPSSNNFSQTNASTIIYVSLKTPTILVDPVFNTTYGSNSFVLNESSTNTETPIQYISNDPNIVSIVNANTIVVGNVGTTTVTLYQPASLNYASITANTIVNVNKITAVITVNPVYNVIYGNITSFYLYAYSNNRDIPITYVSTHTDVADVVSDLVTVNNLGTTTILLSQDSTQNYTSAFSQTTVNVNEKVVPPPKKKFVTAGNDPTRNSALRYSEIINNIGQNYKTWNYKKK